MCVNDELSIRLCSYGIICEMAENETVLKLMYISGWVGNSRDTLSSFIML